MFKGNVQSVYIVLNWMVLSGTKKTEMIKTFKNGGNRFSYR